MSLPLSSKLVFSFLSLVGAVDSAALTIHVPQCPKHITVTKTQPIAPDGWQVSLASRYIDTPDKYQLKDGTYKTTSIAPQVSYIHHERSQKVRALSPTDEEFFESEEIYSWVMNEEEDWVFFCDFDDKIFIYQPINKGVSKCSLSIKLKNGERSWGGQSMKCFAK